MTSPFGLRASGLHEGIDIGALVGTPVLAAADGEVRYSGEMRGYGRVVLVVHQAGWSTLYAHNDTNLVRPGERVRKGQLLATLGRSGRTTGPNLHFEVRRLDRPVDPLPLLPRSQVASPARSLDIGG